MTAAPHLPSMLLDQRALRLYLEAHLSGAQMAERLTCTLCADKSLSIDVREQCAQFLGELRQDKARLQSCLRLVDGTDTLVQRAGRIVGNTFTWARGLFPAFERRQPFIEVELLAVGVAGKRLLWSTLGMLSTLDQRFADLPIDLLTERANGQERALIGLRNQLMVSFLTRQPRQELSPHEQRPVVDRTR